MTSTKYLNIQRKNILDKVMREGKKKQVKIVTNLGIVGHRVVIRIVKKCIVTQFTIAWTSITIKEVSHRFHQNFQIGLQIDSHKYMGVNLGCITLVQQKAKHWAQLSNKQEGVE